MTQDITSKEAGKKGAEKRWGDKVTKKGAVIQLLKDNGGSITLTELYQQIEKYYPVNKGETDWKAGLRGIINRELDTAPAHKGKGTATFTRKGKGTVALL